MDDKPFAMWIATLEALWDWDPIGVGVDRHETPHEYDCLARELIDYSSKIAPASLLKAHLISWLVYHVELDVDLAAVEIVSQRLARILSGG